MPQRKKVAIDVDFTIADILNPMLEMHNAANSTKCVPEDITDWSWSSIGFTQESWNSIYVDLWNNRSDKIRLMLDCALLDKAMKSYDIAFVTSRGGYKPYELTCDSLRSWLKKHNLGHVDLVISDISKHKTELDYDIYIDDSPHLAKEMGNHKGKFMFIVDMITNRYMGDSENVERVADVNEALMLLIASPSA